MKRNTFELFASGFAFASLFSCTFIYTAYIFGALAILFAILSRGPQMHFSRRAKLSIFLGIVGMVVGTVLFIAGIFLLLEEHGSFENILRYYSELNGLNFEEEFGVLFQ